MTALFGGRLHPQREKNDRPASHAYSMASELRTLGSVVGSFWVYSSMVKRCTFKKMFGLKNTTDDCVFLQVQESQGSSGHEDGDGQPVSPTTGVKREREEVSLWL